ncbi:FAD-binding protein [Streptomyces sp. NPDC091266]|uniref:FAD-binding protein n=1 Tax=Streptomyces sp. NPDC091266 TaxID=3365978 RepID=UPI0038038588
MHDGTPVGGIEAELIRRGDPGYEDARSEAVWNGRTPQRFPDAIVRAGSTDEVARAVTYARAHGLRVAIRSGGHNWSGAPLRDGLPGGPLPLRRDGRFPAQRRARLELPGLGPGLRGHRGDRGRHRRRPDGRLRRDTSPGSLLGRTGRGPGILRRRHPFPPRPAPPAGRHHDLRPHLPPGRGAPGDGLGREDRRATAAERRDDPRPDAARSAGLRGSAGPSADGGRHRFRRDAGTGPRRPRAGGRLPLRRARVVPAAARTDVLRRAARGRGLVLAAVAP